MYKRIVLFILFAFTFALAQDQIPGSRQITVPENIQSIKNAIRDAETNEDWEAYKQLRTQLINAWQQVNPDVAKLYGNINDGTPDLTPDGMPADHPRTNINNSKGSILFESSGYNQSNSSLWGDDKLVTGGTAFDISMDISRDGEIYLAVVGRLDGTSNKDSVYMYKSVDGGSTWSLWGSIFASTRTFEQVEIMCFDGQIGGSGDSYILLFFRFDNGWIRVGRSLSSSPSFNYYTLTGGSGGGYSTDFAVDRNNSLANYRAMCIYDSANVIKSIRSEPTSNGTVWQDAANVGTGTLGKDIDFCYGWNGDVYVTFNGYNSGNLYAIENKNYADPTSWETLNTIVTGSTDTTRHAEIISTREDDPNNTAVVLFELKSGNTYDLYSITKASGGSTWGSMVTWVTTNEDKWASLYSRKTDGNTVFEAVFEQSGTGNALPRTIRYKPYNGSSWSTSVQVSDDGNDVTGLQKPEVGDIDGSTPVFAYVGGSYLGVYFDNFSWIPVSVENETVPTTFALEQNYPNPFNPSTLIKFNLAQNSAVKIKIYDVIGNEITNLVSGTMDAGNHEVTFDGRNLSSGIYFYKMEATPLNGEKSFIQTKKMMLIK